MRIRAIDKDSLLTSAYYQRQFPLMRNRLSVRCLYWQRVWARNNLRPKLCALTQLRLTEGNSAVDSAIWTRVIADRPRLLVVAMAMIARLHPARLHVSMAP
jgi:hypothetical protein